MAPKRAPETAPQTTLRAGLPDRYLTPDDLMQMFSLPSIETLYTWRKTGVGPPAIRIGKYLRYDPSAVRAWVESNTEITAA
ncbi:AlpA family transcriptional regulator [Streptomyces sp. or43]|uniref:helix-turn-helix transcriptional regulator n=1 Tax=unclassified Streptomyces TaxID=2593676 RepID=UPI0011CE35AB|nr:helix-turn-helix domain-containing protein [Streptomyces sp. or43]TXS38529.1 DNA-binding protein [Streptomyces sp. or43]